jgi:hypothetical protein
MNSPPSSPLSKTYCFIAGQKATHLSFVLLIHLILGKLFEPLNPIRCKIVQYLLICICWSYLFVGTIMRNGFLKMKDVNPHIRILKFQYREWNL